MLGGLAVLLTGFILWFGLVAPLGRLAAAAEERRAEAAAALIQTRSLAAAVSLATGAAPADPANVVRRSAAAAGLHIAREQSAADGRFSVWLDGVPSTSLFTWLASFQAGRGLSVETFEAHRGEAGGIDARVVFVPAGK
jgi:type II secretory pathway component PulM